MDRRIRFLVLCVLVLTAGMAIEIFLLPHYMAPFTAARSMQLVCRPFATSGFETGGSACWHDDGAAHRDGLLCNGRIAAVCEASSFQASRMAKLVMEFQLVWPRSIRHGASSN